MDALNAMLTDMLGPAGPLIAVAGLAFLLILASIPLMLSSKPDPMDKLKQSGREKLDAETKAILRDKRKNAKLNKYAQYLEPKSAEELGQMRLKLLQAGYRTRDAVRLYYLAQMVLGLGLLGARSTTSPSSTARIRRCSKSSCTSSAPVPSATWRRNTGSPSGSRNARCRSKAAFPTRST